MTMVFFLTSLFFFFFFFTLVFAAARASAAAANANANNGIIIELPPLPYAYDALEPFISRRTLEIHHDKHNAKYVNTMNEMIQGTDLESLPSLSLDDIVKKSYRMSNNLGLFNNAAQSWNHAFYWNCMKKNGGGAPPKDSTLAKLIDSSFGSFEAFRAEFATAGNTAFGSGWAWLVYCHHNPNNNNNNNNNNTMTPKLQVLKTIGAGNPMTSHLDYNNNENDMMMMMTPILTMDVWEHAYYLDYQNMRNTYVDTFLDKLVHWDFVAENLERAIRLTETEEGRGGGAEAEL